MRDRDPAPTSFSRRAVVAGAGSGALAMSAPMLALGATAPTVKIEPGSVEGYWHGDVAAFKGIPYGGPVDGANRWKAAAKPVAWSGVKAANAYGPRAMQRDEDNLKIVNQEVLDLLTKGGPPSEEWAAMGENCLTLNVWSPALDKGANLPVMVWLHGGGFFAEVPPIWWNDGAAMAKFGGVVVVTVRHRLGAFGYFDLASAGANDVPDAGNVGHWT